MPPAPTAGAQSAPLDGATEDPASQHRSFIANLRRSLRRSEVRAEEAHRTCACPPWEEHSCGGVTRLPRTVTDALESQRSALLQAEIAQGVLQNQLDVQNKRIAAAAAAAATRDRDRTRSPAPLPGHHRGLQAPPRVPRPPPPVPDERQGLLPGSSTDLGQRNNIPNPQLRSGRERHVVLHSSCFLVLPPPPPPPPPSPPLPPAPCVLSLLPTPPPPPSSSQLETAETKSNLTLETALAPATTSKAKPKSPRESKAIVHSIASDSHSPTDISDIVNGSEDETGP